MTMTNTPQKKRIAISYENMSPELLDAFKEKYPHGYLDYMGDLFKVDKPDGTFFYAVTLETEDALYLVKIKVKIDDYEDVEKELFKEGGDEEEQSDDTFPAEDGDFSSDEGGEDE